MSFPRRGMMQALFASLLAPFAVRQAVAESPSSESTGVSVKLEVDYERLAKEVAEKIRPIVGECLAEYDAELQRAEDERSRKFFESMARRRKPGSAGADSRKPAV